MSTAAERFLTKEKASLEIYGRPGNVVIADLKNLSKSGACLEWLQNGVEIQPGDVVRMTVHLKTLNRQHNLSAEVVWRNGNRTGVNFLRSDQVLAKMMEKT